MKSLLLFLAIAFIFCVHRGRNDIDQEVPTMEQLDSLYQNQWNLPRYDSAKNAANATYLSDTEKRIIYYLNLVRLNPELFANTYGKGYKGSVCCTNDPYFNVNEELLMGYLKTLMPMGVLKPDSTMYPYAACQATVMGQKGIIRNGHSRVETGCRAIPDFAENIDYGQHTPLDVVMMWLNESINSKGPNQYGHRLNCLNRNFVRVCVACRPHTILQQCVVLDLGYPIK